VSWLVVNADDGGLAATTDEAILRCARHGVVRSASVVANGPTAAAFVRRALTQGLDLGLHLNLTQGVALAGAHPTLTDARGRFFPKAEAWRRAAAGVIDPDAVGREADAQWERLVALGAEPTHVDGHNHVHLFPAARDVLAELAAGAWVRTPRDREAPPADLPPVFATWVEGLDGPWRRTERFAGFGFSREPSADGFLASLADGARVTEFMVHPGAREGSAFSASPLRAREEEILCSPLLAREIDRRGFRLASFAEVSCA
jgi:predicted glycoside hydrolase/deacetylase ChbG (UPF0249 family)